MKARRARICVYEAAWLVRTVAGLAAALLLIVPASAAETAPSATLPVPAPAAAASPAPVSGEPADCFEQLENGTGAEIACEVPLRLSAEEQGEIEKGSRGYVKNVACLLTVRIGRADVEAAIAARDIVYESAPQPVACTVTTHKSSFDITATFAPRFVVRDDVAVEATPGLADVKGVTRVLSWPVVQFVNRWPSIRNGLLQIVNAYRIHARTKAVKR